MSLTLQLAKAVEKAIKTSPLSLNAATEGSEVLVKLPRMTQVGQAGGGLVQGETGHSAAELKHTAVAEGVARPLHDAATGRTPPPGVCSSWMVFCIQPFTQFPVPAQRSQPPHLFCVSCAPPLPRQPS